MSRRFLHVLLVGLTLGTLGAAPAHADQPRPIDTISDEDKALARQLVATGDDRLRHGDHAGALAAYRGAHTIVGVPTTGIEVARTLAAMSRWVEALEATEAVLAYPPADDEPAAFTAARHQAEILRSELQAQIVTAPGDGEVYEAPTEPIPLPPPPPRELPVILWVGIATGATGLMLGSIHGIASLVVLADVDDRCRADGVCPSSERDDVDRAELLAHASTVAFAIAGAGALMTVAGLLWPSLSDDEDVALEPFVAPGIAGLTGRF